MSTAVTTWRTLPCIHGCDERVIRARTTHGRTIDLTDETIPGGEYTLHPGEPLPRATLRKPRDRMLETVQKHAIHGGGYREHACPEPERWWVK